MYDVLELSKYIITKCTKEDEPISNLQLQKILYYIQKAFLQAGKIAFCDDIEAWQFGPVVPEVYYHFCGYGAMPICAEYEDINIFDSDVDSMVEEKRKLNPWDMVKETHQAGGAWDQTYRQGSGSYQVIPKELIRTAG